MAKTRFVKLVGVPSIVCIIFAGMWLISRQPAGDEAVMEMAERIGVPAPKLADAFRAADSRLRSLGIDLDAHPELTAAQRSSLRLAATGESDEEVLFYADVAISFQQFRSVNRERALQVADRFFRIADRYSPQAPGSPDDLELIWHSRRASGSAFILAAAWAARGPFDHLQGQYEALAIRLATCRDFELRRHAAILLWVMKHVPQTRVLSFEAERTLQVTLAPDRAQMGYDKLLETHRQAAIAAGARWPEGVAP